MDKVTVIGARPQFIKAAAVSRAVAERDDITEVNLPMLYRRDDAAQRIVEIIA